MTIFSSYFRPTELKEVDNSFKRQCLLTGSGGRIARIGRTGGGYFSGDHRAVTRLRDSSRIGGRLHGWWW